MRHQKAAELNIRTYLEKIVKVKHLATQELLWTAMQLVIERCNEYTNALPKLRVPSLAAWDPLTKEAFLSCYNVRTFPLSELKDDILKALKNQGDVNLLRCPYCMLNEPKTWDHYLPKNSYPEYSVYHENLIYVCFGCNQIKRDHYNAKMLLYCHPYFSVPESKSLLHCSVEVAGSVLIINYYGADDGSFSSEGDIFHRHIQRLDLVSSFQAEAASLVSNLIGELRYCFPKGIDREDLQAVLRSRYRLAEKRLGKNAWDARLWHALNANLEFLEYANARINSAEVPSDDGFEIPAPPRP